MRSKILAKLKEKFPGLSEKFLGLLATQMEKKVTEDSQMEGALAALDSLPIPVTELAAEFQKEGDARVTAAQKKWKEENPGKTDPPKTDPPPTDPKPGDANAELLKEIREMRQEMTTMKSQATQKQLSERLTAKLTEKKIPLKLASGRKLEKEEDLDAVLAEVESDYAELKQGFIDQGLLSSTPPKSGDAMNATGANADKVISDWSKANNPAPAKV